MFSNFYRSDLCNELVSHYQIYNETLTKFRLKIGPRTFNPSLSSTEVEKPRGRAVARQENLAHSFKTRMRCLPLDSLFHTLANDTPTLAKLFQVPAFTCKCSVWRVLTQARRPYSWLPNSNSAFGNGPNFMILESHMTLSTIPRMWWQMPLTLLVAIYYFISLWIDAADLESTSSLQKLNSQILSIWSWFPWLILPIRLAVGQCK